MALGGHAVGLVHMRSIGQWPVEQEVAWGAGKFEAFKLTLVWRPKAPAALADSLEP